MRVLVSGANGFIGRQIVSALLEDGHEVVAAVRRPDLVKKVGRISAVACDFSRDFSPQDWQRRLAGIDAVVNCAGILRARNNKIFDDVHRAAPKALFEACVLSNIRKVIQISALGKEGDSLFVSSKHQGDACLTGLDLDWVVFRPSVVYTPFGSYGGTSLLRALSALPYVVILPGDGRQLLQPIAGRDLALAVVRAVESDCCNRQIIEAVGPETVTLEYFLRTFRDWLGFSPARSIKIPLWLVWPVAWLGEWLGRGPLGRTMYRMLQRGNIGAADAYQTFVGATGVRPGSLSQVLALVPAYVQDRWHARLYLLRPLLRVSLGILWIVSALAGFLTPLTVSAELLGQAGVSVNAVAPLVYGTSFLDVLLGGLLLANRGVHIVGVLMFVSLVVYTGFLGTFMPGLWLEPLGALTKNIPLIFAVLIMLALEDVR